MKNFFSESDVEWISNNQFVFDGNFWHSTKIYYSGCFYTTQELYELIQKQNK